VLTLFVVPVVYSLMGRTRDLAKARAIVAAEAATH
jgi:hypothetical protein